MIHCPNCTHPLKMMSARPTTSPGVKLRYYRCLGGCQRGFTVRGSRPPERKAEKPCVQV